LRAEATHWAGDRQGALRLLEELQRSEGGDPRVLFALGLSFARLEIYDRAEAAFTALLAQLPEDYDVLHNLGRAAARAQHLDRAQRAFEVALKLKPDDVESLFELGRVHSARQDYDRAVFLLAKARKLAPQHPGILLALARAAEDAGYYGDATIAYDEYLQLRPDDDTARRDRALILGYTLTHVEEGIQELAKYVEKHPKDALGHYYLGQLTAVNKSEEALAPLSEALKLEPDLAPALYTRAFILHKLGRTTESVVDLEAAIRSNPKDRRALDQLGLVYLTIERPADAEKVLRQALEISPNEPEVLMHMGRALMDLGREEEAQQFLDQFEKARQEKVRSPRHTPGVIEFASLSPAEQRDRLARQLQQWIQTRPGDHPLRLRFATVLLGQGKVDEAAATFRELLAMNPDSRISREAGATLLRAGQFDLARSYLERAIADDPAALLDLAIAVFPSGGPEGSLAVLEKTPEAERNADFYLLKAKFLDDAGKLADSAAALQQGAMAAPSRADLSAQAALLLLKRNRMKEAFELVEKALSRLPDNPDLLLSKVVVLERMSKGPEAEKLLRQLQARWPEWDQVYFVRALLLAGTPKQNDAAQAARLAISLGAPSAEVYSGLARAAGSGFPEQAEKYRKEAARLRAERGGMPEPRSATLEALYPPDKDF
jgi:tetratricopeptide (TPR) repeat protein